MVFERIIRVIGSRPTNYPFMSFDGDSVSRYYSAMSGPQTPAAQLRALVRTYPSALVGYSGGVDSALLPGGPVGDGAGGGAALRYPPGRARHARARGSRLSRESDEPLLLLQDRAVAPARPGGAAPRARHRVRRYERRRPARAPPRVRRRAGGGRALAARRGGAEEGGCPACRARARASGMGCTGGTVPFEPGGLRDPDHVGAS